MGRPIKSAETVGGTSKLASVNTVLPIGASGLGGNQIIMRAFVTGGSAQVTTNVIQKGTKRFRCTTATGTETLTLVAVVHGSISAGQCQLNAVDSAAGTYFVSRIGPNWIEIGALGTGTQVAVGDRVQWVDDQTSAVAINTGTYAIGDVNQPGRFQVVTA